MTIFSLRSFFLSGLLCLAAACGSEREEAMFLSTEEETEARILIAGSSTVAPFIVTSAEYFGLSTDHPTPVVEVTGTGGGFKLACQRNPGDPIAIAMASRPMTPSEKAMCEQNEVADLIELQFGYDGIVVISSVDAPDVSFTREHLYKAFAKELFIKGRFRSNPYTLWSEIDSSLPDAKIEVFGPPPTSGTRDAFLDLVMAPGAYQSDAMRKIKEEDPDRFYTLSHTVRTDGVWTDSGENDTQIIQSLIRNDNAFGIVGFSYLDQSSDRVKAAAIDGVSPDFSTITNAKYTVTRSLYLYINSDKIAESSTLQAFVRSIYDNAAMGPAGYLLDKGLIPLTDVERSQIVSLESILGETG